MDAVALCETIIKAKQKLLEHYDHPDNNIGYVFSVAGKIPDLYDLIKIGFNDTEQSKYISAMSDILVKIDEYKKTEEGMRNRSVTGIQDKITKSVEKAKISLKK